MREPYKFESMLAGQTYTAVEVRKLVYRAFREGEGGHTSSQWHGQLGLANLRLGRLSELFPKLFPEKLRAASKHDENQLAFSEGRA